VICVKLELQVLKYVQFSLGWFILAARLVRAQLDFLHIMGSNTIIFTFLKAGLMCRLYTVL